MILVTGGTGFLGSYIIKNLIEKGYQVRATRRSVNPPFWIPEEILQKIEWFDTSLLDPMGLYEAMEGVDHVIHSAAVVSFFNRDRKKMYAANVEGTANVVNAALERNVKRLVHVSSIAALGRTTKSETVTEAKKWEHNRNNTHYAISKHQAEMQVWRGFAEGLEGVIINPSTLLGFGNWHQTSTVLFKNIYKGFNWYSCGVNGFVGVEDTAEAAVRLLFSDVDQRRFIVNADNWVFRDLFHAIADGFNKPRAQKEVSKTLGEIAWRLEAVRSWFTGKKPLLTKETAKVAQSKTSFDGSALLEALPGFQYTPLDTVIKNACEKYEQALQKGLLTL